MAIQRADPAMPQSPSSLPSGSAPAPIFRVDIPLLPESAVGNALQFIDLLRGANLLAGLRLGAHAPRLAWRLLRDKRVTSLKYAIPLLLLAYLLSPVDAIPDLLLGIGQTDDLGVAVAAGVLLLILGSSAWITVLWQRALREQQRAVREQQRAARVKVRDS